ncbi:hypothetical protein glysoja_017018 [Glycine soja]|nr:hypothetical protein glysoja_017018 [Glycine soja]
MEVYSKKASSDRSHAKENITKPHHVVLGGSNNVSPSSGPFGQVAGGSFMKPNLDHVNNDDVTSVLSELVRRKNTVIVGEGVANAEGVAREVMERFEVGNVPGDLSDFQAEERSKVFFEDVAFEDRTGVRNHLTCCRDCLINFEKEAQSITNCISNKVCIASSLPTWLQNCKEERSDIMEDQFYDFNDDGYDSNFIMFMPDRDVPKPDLLSNPNSSPNSASSSEAVDGLESTQMFKEPNAENHKILCDALEKKIPQHKDVIVPEIASTVLHCRSGMRKRGLNHLMNREENQETWMFFLGVNSQAKESISRELAKVVFGSYSNFVSIGMSNFSSPEDDHDSTDEKSKRKRPREELKSSYVQRFGEAVNENPHRVFFLEDLDQVDYFSQKGVKQAIQSGSITLPSGESVPLKDAIVIFSCESFSSPKLRKSPCAENKGKEITVDDESSSLSLDLNLAIEDESGGVALGGDNGILDYT